MSEKLGTYVNLQGGFAFKSSDFVESGIPLVRIGNVTTNGLNLTDAIFLPRHFQNELKDFLVEENDTLIAMSGATTGKCCIIKKEDLPCLINQRVGRFKVLNEIETDKVYVYYVVTSEVFQNELLKDAFGSAQPNISPKQIEKVPWRFPEFDVQTKIAHILSTCDAVIEKTQSAIAKYKAIKQGMLQDLFTRGIDITTNKLRPRFEEAPHLYKESKLGMIPREWEEKELGNCGTFRKGGNIPKYALSHSGIGCVLYGQLYTTFDNIINKVKSKVPQQIVGAMTPLRYGSILFAGSGETHEEIGKCAVLLIGDEDIYAGGDVVILDLYEEYFNPYFGYYLNFQPIQSQKSKFGQGSSVIHIYANHLSSINVALPPRNEQEKIFEIIDQFNNKLQTEQTYLQKIQQLKKGLMEDLLSGKKKVIINEPQLYEQQG